MNLRVVRKKIKSVKNVKKITKAMQMVSAVKMRKAQQLEFESRPYRDGLTELIAKIGGKVDPQHAAILQVDVSQAKKTLMVIITSNKGLAGAFNVNIFRNFVKQHLNFKEIDFITVGSKGAQFLSRVEGAHIIADFSSATSFVNEASAMFTLLLEKYFTGEYKQIVLVYNKFISTLRSEVAEDTLLPFELVREKEEAQEEMTKEYMIEPSPKEILEELLKSFLEQKIRGALISSEAVEHSSRMMAMKSATDNASELVYDLTLLSNKLRQNKITNELLDMITAKESVDAG
jgi:F-type H+-transporting ATPase subunit gamma